MDWGGVSRSCGCHTGLTGRQHGGLIKVQTAACIVPMLVTADCIRMATTRASAYPQASAEWEEHRETITQLYLAENRPLKDVKKVMEELHGFKAT